MNLTGISSDRVRNIVRGIVASKEVSQMRAPFESLRKEGSAGDVASAYRFLYKSSLAEHVPLPENFPTSISRVSRLPRFSPARFEIELAHQKAKLEQSELLLVAAIGSIKGCNESALKGDVAELDKRFEHHTEHFGLSLFMMLKAVSLRQSSMTQHRKAGSLSNYLNAFLSPRRQLLAVAFEDYADKEVDWLRARRVFYKFLTENKLRDTDGPLIADLFSSGSTEFYEPSEVLQAYGRWSGIDTVAYLFRLLHHLDIAGKSEAVLQVRDTIPESVRSAWQSAFKSIDTRKLVGVLNSDIDFAERSLFIHSPAWSEYSSILRYRALVETSFGDRLNGTFPASRAKSSPLFSLQTSARALLKRTTTKISISKTTPSSCGHFHRTLSLIASFEDSRRIEVTDE